MLDFTKGEKDGFFIHLSALLALHSYCDNALACDA